MHSRDALNGSDALTLPAGTGARMVWPRKDLDITVCMMIKCVFTEEVCKLRMSGRAMQQIYPGSPGYLGFSCFGLHVIRSWRPWRPIEHFRGRLMAATAKTGRRLQPVLCLSSDQQ